MLSLSDDGFITQDEYLDGENFNHSEDSGYNLDNQALLLRVRSPVSQGPSFP